MKNSDNIKNKTGLKKLIEFLLSICVSYTLVSVCGTIINILGGYQATNLNIIMMFTYSCIACIVLYLHKLFDNFSPLFMIVAQYIIAMVLVCGVSLIISIIIKDNISPSGWFDLFRSFTIPYVIGAAVYYICLFREAKKQDQLIHEIQKSQDH